MRVAVTGATGLVGADLCELLQQNNISVFGLSRNQSILPNHEENKIPIHKVDYKNMEDLKTVFQNVDAIIHCAAKIGDWGREEEYVNENTSLLNRIFESTNQKQKIIYISSQGVYPFGDHFGTKEEDPIAYQGIDGYTQSKIACENMCRQHQANGRNISILRPGFIYGARDQHLLPKVIEALQKNRVVFFGSGKEILNLTDTRLISKACLAILSSTEHFQSTDCFNIRDDVLLSKLEFFETVAKELKIPFQAKLLPKHLGLTLCKIMEQTGKLLRFRKAPLLTKAKFKFLGNHLNFSNEKMHQKLKVYGGDFRTFRLHTYSQFSDSKKN